MSIQLYGAPGETFSERDIGRPVILFDKRWAIQRVISRKVIEVWPSTRWDRIRWFWTITVPIAWAALGEAIQRRMKP